MHANGEKYDFPLDLDPDNFPRYVRNPLVAFECHLAYEGSPTGMVRVASVPQDHGTITPRILLFPSPGSPAYDFVTVLCPHTVT